MIKILLGSENKSKKEAIELALNKIGIRNYSIISVKVDSKVSSKPINKETLIGAKNRNRKLLNYANKNNIDFDSSSIISTFKMMNNIEIYNALERKLM